MKLLIAYATKTGNSREMAELLASHLPHCDVTLLDVKTGDADPAAFDYAVFGGAVHYGRVLRPMRRFVRAHEAALAAMPHSLFLTCAAAEQFENYVARSFPKEIAKSAERCAFFGGELKPERHRGVARLVVRAVRNAVSESEEAEAALPGLLPEHVRLLADFLREK